MKKKIIEETSADEKRFEILSQTIDEVYGFEGYETFDSKQGLILPFKHPAWSEKFDGYVEDMFEVSSIGRDHVKLRHWLDKKIYFKTNIDFRVKRVLRRRDLFLLTMGIRESIGTVLFMSSPGIEIDL